MHACPALLEELQGLIADEEKALADEDVDKAEALATRRADLLQQAWQAREGFDASELQSRLEALLVKQRQLEQQALALQQSLRERQSAGRKQTRYLNGDRYIHAQAQRSFYCDRIS